MNKIVQAYIESITYLFSQGLAVLNSDFEMIYTYEDCNEESFKECVKKIKNSTDDNIHIVLSNGNNIKSSKITIQNECYYFLSIEKIDSNPNNYQDPLLAKVSFFLNDLTDGTTILKNNHVIFRNDSVTKLLGLSDDVKDKAHYSEFIKSPEYFKKFQNIIMNENNGNLVSPLKTITGEDKWVTFSLNKIELNDDIYHIVSVNDITEQVLESESYRTEKEYLNLTLKAIQEGVVICNTEGKISLFNSMASKITGYKDEEVLNKDINEYLRLIDRNGNLIKCSAEKEDFKDDDVLIESADGLFRHASLSSSKIIDEDGNTLGKVVVMIDTSEAKKKEKEILYLSYHDILTGLYNRTYLEVEVKRLDTERQLPFSIMMGDVNGLKITNDVFGHDAGDNLLRKVAEVLKKACRQEDIIGRWGGDEFIILLPNTSEEETYVVMKRVIREFESLDQRDSINGLLPSISIGYGVKTNSEDDIYDTLKIAESNMYKRKMLSKESMHSSIITSMKASLHVRSNETEEHANRLFELCNKVGKRYNLTSDEFNDLELLCMLHDIGKIGISDVVLKKPGKLNEEEWEEMRRHPEIGYRIAQATPELKKVGKYILGHHERFDGTGYPKGLSKYDIPLINRILSVSDAYDAMTNDRTYRLAMSSEDAIQEILDNSGTQFDPDVVKIFLDVL